MKSFIALLVIGACIAAPCALAAERFTSDKPTPLKQLKPGKDDGTTVRFAGSVQLTGQFAMVWELKNDKPIYRRITFFPDAGSAALLPHPAGDKAVVEVLLTNPERAGAMLRDLIDPRDGAATRAARLRGRRNRHDPGLIGRRSNATTAGTWPSWCRPCGKDIVVGARQAHPGC